MAYIISDECTACGTCIDECPVEAISEGDIYVIDPELCTDCGACADVCPVEAISEEGDVRVIDADACTGVCFDENFMAIVDHFVGAGGGHADSKLKGFYFFGYTDSHGSLQTRNRL